MNDIKNESCLELRAIYDRLEVSKKGNTYLVFYTYSEKSPFWIKRDFVDDDIAESLSHGTVVSVRVGCLTYNGSAFLTYRVLGIVSKVLV